MPYIIKGNEPVVDYAEISRNQYDYNYPKGLDLKPDSDLHSFIVDKIFHNARISATIMTNRFPQWREIDRKLTAYIPTTDKEKEIKEDDVRKPTSIVFPYSYAIMESLLAYLVTAFFPEPIFRYEGASPDDVLGAIMIEKVIQLHSNKSKIALNLHTMFRDSMAYGLGPCVPLWRKKVGQKVVKTAGDGFWDTLGSFIKGPQKRTIADNQIIFEGNALQNIDPYKYLPDPNVAVQDVQLGEFSGWIDTTNLMDLLSDEQNDSDMFNVRYLNHVKNVRSTVYKYDESERTKKAGGPFADNTVTNPLDVIWMYVKLIPKEWKIGTSEYPEKWLFGLASDSIVIKAKPLGMTHGDFPVVVSAPDFDGYSSTPISRMEILFGLQEVLDWMFNSHVANVRKAINDMLVVDPYLVNVNDLKDPKPGKLIRLRRPAWGRGVENVVQQLAINDITKQNIADSSFVMKFMQQIGGTDNPAMGTLRSGGPDRLSAREFQGTAAGAISRMERIARVVGLQAMQDIGYFFAHNVQQMMTQELYVTTTGRWEETLMRDYADSVKSQRMKVSPFDILVDYDLIVRDGSVPGGNFADVWVQMFQVLASQPELYQSFDLVKIFKHIARNLGAKNVEEFERKTPPTQQQIMPDEQVEEEVQRGDLVPIQGGMQ